MGFGAGMILVVSEQPLRLPVVAALSDGPLHLDGCSTCSGRSLATDRPAA